MCNLYISYIFSSEKNDYFTLALGMSGNACSCNLCALSVMNSLRENWDS